MLGARLFCPYNRSMMLVVILLSFVWNSACSEPVLPKTTVMASDDVSLGTDSGNLDSEDSDKLDVDPAEWDVEMDVDVDSASDVGSSDTDLETGTDIDDGLDVELDAHESPNPYPRCGPVVDLGWVRAGKKNLSIDFSTLQNHVKTGCSDAAPDSHEAVFSFRLSDEGIMNLTSSSPIVSELRRSPCEDNDLALFCSNNGLSDKVAGAGVWFLVLEQRNDSLTSVVEVELELIPTPRCNDAGASQCLDANTIEKCDVTASSPDIPRLAVGACAKGCVDGRCLGDSCGAPIVVTDRVEVEGNSALYNDTHDSRHGTSCHVEANNYHEPELIFELPNLVAGNKVFVEVVGDIVPHNVLFKSSCEGTSECLGYFEETSPIHWDVPADGTYYVIVENGGWVPGEFQISVEIKQD